MNQRDGLNKVRLLESERAARKEIIDLKDKELYYLQVISDLKLQVAELCAQPGGRQSNGTAFEASGHHFSLPVNTLGMCSAPCQACLLRFTHIFKRVAASAPLLIHYNPSLQCYRLPSLQTFSGFSLCQL